tara:strand:+ start:147 stop:629 length:483 start_codon:yes stop_codon:yes gene_type:complete
MANQDPQPEVYSVSSTFAPSATSGTTQTTNVTTSQANNEEVRIYAIQVDIQSETFAALSPLTATTCDFSLTITVGPNNVPSQPIRLRPIWSAESNAMYFTSPILVLFQQPLQVTVTNNQALAAGAGNGRIVTVNFQSDLSIQKVACAPSATDYPRSPMGM